MVFLQIKDRMDKGEAVSKQNIFIVFRKDYQITYKVTNLSGFSA